MDVHYNTYFDNYHFTLIGLGLFGSRYRRISKPAIEIAMKKEST